MPHEHHSTIIANITEQYRRGALAYRQANPEMSYPHKPGTSALESWQQGFDNERCCVHVVHGIDLITSGFEGAVSLSVPPSLQRQPRKTYLAYAHALMTVSGMYGRAAPLVKKNPFVTGLQLRNALRERGDVLSSDFATLIRERIKLDMKMCGAALAVDEVLALEQAPTNARSILLAIGRIQNSYYDRLVRNDVIAKLYRRPPEWTAKILIYSVRRAGLVSSVEFNRQTCTLTAKGWSMVRLMQQPTIEASANNDVGRGEFSAEEISAEVSALRF
jgi:hypothetical protein